MGGRGGDLFSQRCPSRKPKCDSNIGSGRSTMPKHMSLLGPVFSASEPEAFAADMIQSSQQISDDECAGLGKFALRGDEDRTACIHQRPNS